MRRLLIAIPLLLVAGLVLAQKTDTARRTRTIKLTERAGVARVQVPVETSVRVERDSGSQSGDRRRHRRGAPVERSRRCESRRGCVEGVAVLAAHSCRRSHPAAVQTEGTARRELL